jgi:hypothetical protein
MCRRARTHSMIRYALHKCHDPAKHPLFMLAIERVDNRAGWWRVPPVKASCTGIPVAGGQHLVDCLKLCMPGALQTAGWAANECLNTAAVHSHVCLHELL